MAPPLEVFCCYAHKDQAMLEWLKKHLMPLQQQGQITIWSDTNLNAGVEWKKELDQHLESADLILLLISPDFMASDYCYSTEMRRAIVRHDEGSATVIPILLRPTLWQDAPFAKLQMVPANAKPVTSWSHRDDAFHDITMQIKQVVSKLYSRREQIKVNGDYGEPEQRVGWQPEPAQDIFFTLGFDPTKLPLLLTLSDYYSMAFSPDSKVLASSIYDGSIKLWELPSMRELGTLSGHKEVALAMAFSPDGKILVSGSNDHTIKLWELPSMRELCTLIGHTDSIMSMAISPDGKILASSSGSIQFVPALIRALFNFHLGGGNSPIKFWELPSGRELRTLTDHKEMVTDMAISPDGKILASSSGDSTIKLWELPSGYALHTLHTGPRNPAFSIAISPDGKVLASGCNDHTIKLWELPSGRQLSTLPGHTGAIYRVAISPDGKILVGGSADGIIKFWELPSGRELSSFRSHTNAITRMAISPDGKILASSSDRGTLKLWGDEAIGGMATPPLAPQAR